MIKDNTTPPQKPEKDRRILTEDTATHLLELLFVSIFLFIFGALANYIGTIYGVNFLIGMCTGTLAYLTIRKKK